MGVLDGAARGVPHGTGGAHGGQAGQVSHTLVEAAQRARYRVDDTGLTVVGGAGDGDRLLGLSAAETVQTVSYKVVIHPGESTGPTSFAVGDGLVKTQGSFNLATFTVTARDVKALYSRDFEIKALEREDKFEIETMAKSRGATTMLETTYLLTRRAAPKPSWRFW